MKYCVIHNLRFETPAKRDALDEAVKDKVAGKKAWGETVVQSGIDVEGYPFHNLEIRFDNKADMNELFALIKDKLDKIPVLKGAVSKHNCSHDESLPQPCKITQRVEKK
jgi:hypothetical protein